MKAIGVCTLLALLVLPAGAQAYGGSGGDFVARRTGAEVHPEAVDPAAADARGHGWPPLLRAPDAALLFMRGTIYEIGQAAGGMPRRAAHLSPSAQIATLTLTTESTVPAAMAALIAPVGTP
jgi:hypothetical protein